jgi:hypothetical protein
MTKIRKDFTPTQVQTNFGKWLSGENWTHWTTLTTKKEMTINSARRQAEGFHKILNLAGDAKIFFAAEPFDTKEGHHLHALLQLPEQLKYTDIHKAWQYVSGSKTRANNNRIQIEEYNSQKGATFYIGKYITKYLCDYDLLLPLNLSDKQRKKINANYGMWSANWSKTSKEQREE